MFSDSVNLFKQASIRYNIVTLHDTFPVPPSPVNQLNNIMFVYSLAIKLEVMLAHYLKECNPRVDQAHGFLALL